MSLSHCYLESVSMERLAFCNTGAWSLVQGQLGTNMALSALTRIKQKALAGSAFDLRSGRTWGIFQMKTHRMVESRWCEPEHKWAGICVLPKLWWRKKLGQSLCTCSWARKPPCWHLCIPGYTGWETARMWPLLTICNNAANNFSILALFILKCVCVCVRSKGE